MFRLCSFISFRLIFRLFYLIKCRSSFTFILLFFCLYSFVYSNDLFLTNNVEIFKDGKLIAVANMLTPVKVIDEQLVEVRGVLNSSYSSALVRDKDRNEVYVHFSEGIEGLNYVKELGRQEDDYGELWISASISFNVPKESIGTPDELYKQAQELYMHSCSSCHHLHDVDAFTVNAWPPNIYSMLELGYVSLNSLEQMLLIKYLQQHAKDSVKK